MDQEEKGREMLRLYYQGSCTETAMEAVEAVLSRPDIIRVPGAPDYLEGIIYREGRLLPVFKPAVSRDQVSAHQPACVVLIRGEGEKIYGMAADEVAGGGTVDSVY